MHFSHRLNPSADRPGRSGAPLGHRDTPGAPESSDSGVRGPGRWRWPGHGRGGQNFGDFGIYGCFRGAKFNSSGLSFEGIKFSGEQNLILGTPSWGGEVLLPNISAEVNELASILLIVLPSVGKIISNCTTEALFAGGRPKFEGPPRRPTPLPKW